MNVNRRTQADRSASTRTALIAAARPLFAQRGFGQVGTEEIVRAAGVTRGALYHQFADKIELFAAVYEAVEQDLAARMVASVDGSGITDPMEAMGLGARAWLDAALEPEVAQVVLLDGPAVLGWERWREIAAEYGLGLVEALLGEAMQAGRVPEQPVRPLAHVLMGALDEAAMYIARADDQAAARDEVQSVVDRLVAGLTT